ncbi:hypothetical protein EDD22DRAFT_889973 [Suillus occidentalis]|nr:hypothetical protein EDD22DRAFT_889973 [Suillus occidentalis]
MLHARCLLAAVESLLRTACKYTLLYWKRSRVRHSLGKVVLDDPSTSKPTNNTTNSTRVCGSSCGSQKAWLVLYLLPSMNC